MPATEKNILIIRTSAMGDVALTVPVLAAMAEQYPSVQLTLLTDKLYVPFFISIPNLKIVTLNRRGKHKGFWGLIRLFFELKRLNITAVADLHDVLRSQVLRILFALSFVKTEKIDKVRHARRMLITHGKDDAQALVPVVERYREVFERLGYNLTLNFHSIFPEKPALPEILQKAFGKKTGHWIGVAPFAKHRGKIYPPEKMEEVLALLNEQPGLRIFLFGNGAKEKEQMKIWAKEFPVISLLPKEARLPDELQLMAHLDVMLSMDSANMHLASLVNTPVVSVWGATHYYSGFLGYNQTIDNIVEVDLPCRPCSIYGSVPCRRKDYACLNWIAPEAIVEKLKKFL
ncbi:MAG: glycosyltransferase family 9 protein [Prevotellaceae bacterium]|jgi:ADP-heptose:LPS heptosyltransferase|nr:glycosyltransferase family 9 protein [Prevotellaceae bacterium]